LLVGLAGGLVAASLRARPRRALAVALILLLGGLAVEHGVHSVHHLHDQHEAAACVVAVAATHLAAALDADGLVLLAPVSVSRPPAENAAAPPLALRFGPDPSRAPPAPIA
jgi:disulfide bond formation protein DsbB